MFLAIDFDGTLCEGFVNRYLFKHLNLYEKLRPFENEWDSGKISDLTLLSKMASLLSGVSSKQISEGLKSVQFKPGAQELIDFCRPLFPIVVVSQAFVEFLEPPCKSLGIDNIIGSTLRFRDGKVCGPERILANGRAKLEALREFLTDKRWEDEFIMIGDSAGDSALFSEASLSISVGEQRAQHNLFSLNEAIPVIKTFLEGQH